MTDAFEFAETPAFPDATSFFHKTSVWPQFWTWPGSTNCIDTKLSALA